MKLEMGISTSFKWYRFNRVWLYKSIESEYWYGCFERSFQSFRCLLYSLLISLSYICKLHERSFLNNERDSNYNFLYETQHGSTWGHVYHIEDYLWPVGSFFKSTCRWVSSYKTNFLSLLNGYAFYMHEVLALLEVGTNMNDSAEVHIALIACE